MADCILTKAGGGTGSDEVTASKAQVLAGYTALTSDSGDEAAEGTMPNRGAVAQALNCSGSYTIPAGYHNGSGKITANSLASQTGGATATDAYVRSGYTYWKDGVLRTGTMYVPSVVSFSVAAYSVSQVIATWKNPAKGPYAGVIICAKTGGYPTSATDSQVYKGTGSNSALNGSSFQIISGLASGTTYYFRIWMYCGDMYSGYQQVTCTPTAHGRKVFTTSTTFIIPDGVRSINIHCTGGGQGGVTWAGQQLGVGGCGGYTAYKNNVVVTPGTLAIITVGSGGITNGDGGTSSLAIDSTIMCSAEGGNGNYINRKGGSGGGGTNVNGYGGSDGSNGSGSKYIGIGQGVTTREFGSSSGTLYAGGGSGSKMTNGAGLPGGSGGGGSGASVNAVPTTGTAGTGGGGGGGIDDSDGILWRGAAGGSGNVIITW